MLLQYRKSAPSSRRDVRVVLHALSTVPAQVPCFCQVTASTLSPSSVCHLSRATTCGWLCAAPMHKQLQVRCALYSSPYWSRVCSWYWKLQVTVVTGSNTPSEPALPGPPGGKNCELGEMEFVKRVTCGTALQKHIRLNQWETRPLTHPCNCAAAALLDGCGESGMS